MNGYTAEPTSTLNVDGAHYEGKDLPEAWASYFANLATPCDNGYDSEFADYISGEFSNISSQPPADNIEFTPEEVKEAVLSLKLNKAAGQDNLDPEHLVYGGQSLIAYLTVLYNAIMATCHIPFPFLHGLVIPIPKGFNKDLTLPNSYRGITILSNAGKVFEKLLLCRIHEMVPPSSLNPLQEGFRDGYSCLHTAFILQEAIQTTWEGGKKCYVAYLDGRKAFDTVWHEGLLVN